MIKKILIISLLLLILISLSGDIPAEIESVCFEDMPCWDCATMGNLICGDSPPWIDTPWEDFFPKMVADSVYLIVDTFLK